MSLYRRSESGSVDVKLVVAVLFGISLGVVSTFIVGRAVRHGGNSNAGSSNTEWMNSFVVTEFRVVPSAFDSTSGAIRIPNQDSKLTDKEREIVQRNLTEQRERLKRIYKTSMEFLQSHSLLRNSAANGYVPREADASALQLTFFTQELDGYVSYRLNLDLSSPMYMSKSSPRSQTAKTWSDERLGIAKRKDLEQAVLKDVMALMKAYEGFYSGMRKAHQYEENLIR